MTLSGLAGGPLSRTSAVNGFYGFYELYGESAERSGGQRALSVGSYLATNNKSCPEGQLLSIIRAKRLLVSVLRAHDNQCAVAIVEELLGHSLDILKSDALKNTEVLLLVVVALLVPTVDS